MTDIDDDFLQFLFNRLNEGYEEYKRNQPVISPTEVFMRRVQSKSRKSR